MESFLGFIKLLAKRKKIALFLYLHLDASFRAFNDITNFWGGSALIAVDFVSLQLNSKRFE